MAEGSALLCFIPIPNGKPEPTLGRNCFRTDPDVEEGRAARPDALATVSLGIEADVAPRSKSKRLDTTTNALHIFNQRPLRAGVASTSSEGTRW
jgi:hypothetical protein